jgi:hypothetical protein
MCPGLHLSHPSWAMVPLLQPAGASLQKPVVPSVWMQAIEVAMCSPSISSGSVASQIFIFIAASCGHNN